MNEKTYILLGNPIPLARARHGNGRVYDAQKQLKFTAGILLARQHDNGSYFEGALELEACFHFAIAKCNLRRAPLLRSTPHFIRPDLDNLIKFICDISNGIIFKDDCTISSIIAKKVYCDLGDEKTVFTIRELNGKNC